MLKELLISNIVLIEEARLHFEAGFTVFSGETGAGKSAIMEGLKLILGAKTDSNLIRHGASKGVVTGVFDLSLLPKAKDFIQEKGLESDDPHLLIIQREITSTGKTRASLNHRTIHLSLLRELSGYLVEVVGQHENHKLFELEEHRRILDLFGDYEPLKTTYEEAWCDLQEQLKQLKELEKSVPGSAREIEICKREIEEIEKWSWQEGEEEILFESYTLLSSAKDRLTAVQELNHALGNMFSLLAKTKGQAELLRQSDPKIAEEIKLHGQLFIETEELLHSLRRYESRLDDDPAKLEALHARLSMIEKMKRKYGEIRSYLALSKERLKLLENLEDELEEKSTAYKKQLEHVQTLSHELTRERQRVALLLGDKMTEVLASLNMKNGRFHVEISPCLLSHSGQDQVEFFLHTNVGEKLISVKEGASGGELARVLLALHLLLAGKEKIGTLIFDEIDANIGGTTAAMMGEHFKTLAQSLQIVVITHFPQVARYACHHLQIAKATSNGRTLSHITYLEGSSREDELARMAGTQLCVP